MERMREICVARGDERDIVSITNIWGSLDRGSTYVTTEFSRWYTDTLLASKFTIAAAEDHQWLPATTIEWAQNFADVVLKPTMENTTSLVGKTKSTRDRPIPVLYLTHKAILSCSQVFAAIFRSPWLEGKQSAGIRVVSVDCSPPALEVVLEALCTGMFICPEILVAEVICTADMLLMEPLKVKAGLTCAGMVERLSTDDVEDLYRLSGQVRMQCLEKRVGQTLARRYDDVLLDSI